MSNRLTELLNKMEVPEQRKADFHWLRRNLGVRNSEHPDFPEAVKLIKETLRK